MLRVILLTCGTLSLVLGVIAIFLPLLPTTPFVLLATACFAKSSVTVHQRLLSNKYFGPIVKNWDETGTMPRKAKLISLTLLNFSLLVSAVFFASNLLIVLVLAVVGFGVNWYLFRIPTTESLHNPDHLH